MKTTRERREELEGLLFKKNVDSIVEKMYESDEIFYRVDDLSLDEVYNNFKIVVEEQIKKRSIKNVKRWLYILMDPHDEITTYCIRKYCLEEIDGVPYIITNNAEE